jgi:hypothetical protein
LHGTQNRELDMPKHIGGFHLPSLRPGLPPQVPWRRSRVCRPRPGLVVSFGVDVFGCPSA